MSLDYNMKNREKANAKILLKHGNSFEWGLIMDFYQSTTTYLTIMLFGSVLYFFPTAIALSDIPECHATSLRGCWTCWLAVDGGWNVEWALPVVMTTALIENQEVLRVEMTGQWNLVSVSVMDGCWEMLIVKLSALRMYIALAGTAAIVSPWSVFVVKQPEEKENSTLAYSMPTGQQRALRLSVLANLLYFHWQ